MADNLRKTTEQSENEVLESGSVKPAERFSLVLGGPFHAVLRHLGLTGADQLPTRRAAFGLAVLAWLPPALLAVFESLTEARYSGWGYFTDWTAHTRYLIAIWFLVATERYADGRLIALTRHFREAGILSEAGLPTFKRALERWYCLGRGGSRAS